MESLSEWLINGRALVHRHLSLARALNHNVILLLGTRKQENGKVNTFPPLGTTPQSDLLGS